MKGYTDYNKEDVFKILDKISIFKTEGNQVITKFGDRIINTSPVSDRYEAFDISKYLKDKIEVIEKNFNITKYSFHMTRGVQYLKLISDKVEIGGVDFYKSFYILNSSDKSRRLSFNLGLYSESNNFYSIIKNSGLTKKHLKGVTKAAEDASVSITDETFNEQISSMESLVGHKVSLSNISKVILGDNEKIPAINHKKFDAFKNAVKFSKVNIDNAQLKTLSTYSEKLIIDNKNDFFIDAFQVFQLYLRLFNKQDSHIIRNETERIMGITQWAVRNNILESLGI